MTSSKIKSIFANDPEVLRALEAREQADLLKEIARTSILREGEETKKSTEVKIEFLKGEKGDIGEQGEQGEKGEKGEQGEQGERGEQGEKGEIGKAGSRGERGPQGTPGLAGEKGEKGEQGKGVSVKEILGYIEQLKGEEATQFAKALASNIDISWIRNAGSFMYKGTRYRMEELMHGGGSSSSSGGTTVLPVTGTIDDSNTVFAVTQQPVQVNINGGYYISTGGIITWTWVAGVLTLSSPVGTGGSIFATL